MFALWNQNYESVLNLEDGNVAKSDEEEEENVREKNV